MQPAIKKRIAGTLSANLFGQLVTVGTQLVNVPLFLSVWGKELYGEWLVIGALPVLIGQSCGGFASAGGTEMIVRGRDNRDAAVAIFHTSALITALIAAVTVAAAVVAAALNLGRYFEFTQMKSREIDWLLVLFGIQVALHVSMGLVVAGFRAAESFARGFMWQHLTRLGVFFGGAISLLAGGGVLTVAAAMLAGQILVISSSLVAMRLRVPWLSLGVSHSTQEEFRRLIRPSLADTIYPLAMGLRAQALVVVLGFAATPTAAAVFAALRTLSSTLLQLSRILQLALQQEMSVAFGERRIALMQKMHHRLLRYSFWGTLAASAALLAFGRPLFDHWTRGKLPYSFATLAILLTCTLLTTLAMVNATVLRSVNRHVRLSAAMLAAIGAAILLALPLAAQWGTAGAAAALLAADFAVLAYSAKQSVLVTADSPTNLLLSVFRSRSQEQDTHDRPIIPA